MEFSIGELARRSGYAVQTVRYYEQNGLMPAPARTAGGQRRYDETQLRQLLFIRHARDLGFEVDAIRSLLRLAAHPDAPCNSVDAIARDHLAAITHKIARLSALRQEVTRMIEQCRRGRIAECRVIDALLSDRQTKASQRSRGIKKIGPSRKRDESRP
ncbi:MAG: helix-turn-helix domain-containing protein [Hyphomonadaceae bacterium]|jgi:DNA-binding transcriptional MerR regulator|nr:helix-turn-helix domain-containing protein [Hyphomonadaceae bacterium]